MARKSESILVAGSAVIGIILLSLFMGSLGVFGTCLGIHSILTETGPAWTRIAPGSFVGVLAGAGFVVGLIQLSIPSSRVDSAPKWQVRVMNWSSVIAALAYVGIGSLLIRECVHAPAQLEKYVGFSMAVLVVGLIGGFVFGLVLGLVEEKKN